MFSTHEVPSDLSLFDILPSATDYKDLKENFAILVARTMQEHIPFFGGDFKGLIPAHTPHQYSDNMAAKSEVVSTIAIIIMLYIYKVAFIIIIIGSSWCSP